MGLMDKLTLAAELHRLHSHLFCWERDGKVSSSCKPNAVRHQQQAEAILAAQGWHLEATPPYGHHYTLVHQPRNPAECAYCATLAEFDSPQRASTPNP